MANDSALVVRLKARPGGQLGRLQADARVGGAGRLAGLDGRGGSSYIDRTIFRDRDANGGATGDGTREERRYFLQNWRNDVVGLVDTIGNVIERYRYDAYGRPESYTPADLTGNVGGPNGTITGADYTQFGAVWSVGGPVTWQTDVGQSGGFGGPDGVTDNNDSIAFTTYYFAGSTGGIGLMSQTAVNNRKGLAGYEFDPILAGNGNPIGTAVPLYHVRRRVLNAYAGKWLQKDPLRYHDGMDLYEYCASDPMDLLDPKGTNVRPTKIRLCKRPPSIPCAPPNAMHWWLWIDSPVDPLEVGLGPCQAGVPQENCEDINACTPEYCGDGTGTSWNDHSGERNGPRGGSIECWDVEGCNVACLQKNLILGERCGMWMPGINDCNTRLRSVLELCGCKNECIWWITIPNPFYTIPGWNEFAREREYHRCIKWLF